MDKKIKIFMVSSVLVIIILSAILLLIKRNNNTFENYIIDDYTMNVIDVDANQYDVIIDNVSNINILDEYGLTKEVLYEQIWTTSEGINFITTTFYYNGCLYGISIENNIMSIYRSAI